MAKSKAKPAKGKTQKPVKPVVVKKAARAARRGR
jgi:hypothetical protein